MTHHHSHPTAPASSAIARWWGPVTVVTVLAAAVVFIAGRNPHEQQIFPPCAFLSLTGWTCPGCGGTRAVYDIVNLDFASAVTMNAMVTLSFVPLALAGMAWWIGVTAGKLPRPKELSPHWAWAYVALLVAFTVVRNIPILSPYLNP